MDIVFSVPNLISYIRIGLVVLAFSNFNNCILFVGLYAASYVIHGIARIVAKLLKQETTFGNILSMIIDRSTTGSLLIMLAHICPEHKLMFISSMVLDMMSHWYLVNSSLAINLKDHRTPAVGEDILVTIYYHTPLLVPMTVLLCEQFYLIYYIGYFNSMLWNMKEYIVMLYISGGVYVLKQIIHILQIKVSLLRYITIDEDNAHKAANKVCDK